MIQLVGGPVVRIDCVAFYRKTQSVEREDEHPTWTRVKRLFR